MFSAAGRKRDSVIIIIKYVKYFFWVEYHKNINSPITSAINAALEIVSKIAYEIRGCPLRVIIFLLGIALLPALANITDTIFILKVNIHM